MRTRAATTTGTPRLMRWPGSFPTIWLIRCRVYSSTRRGEFWELNTIKNCELAKYFFTMIYQKCGHYCLNNNFLTFQTVYSAEALS